jgi:hypothetical protein
VVGHDDGSIHASIIQHLFRGGGCPLRGCRPPAASRLQEAGAKRSRRQRRQEANAYRGAAHLPRRGSDRRLGRSMMMESCARTSWLQRWQDGLVVVCLWVPASSQSIEAASSDNK